MGSRKGVPPAGLENSTSTDSGSTCSLQMQGQQRWESHFGGSAHVLHAMILQTVCNGIIAPHTVMLGEASSNAKHDNT